MCKEHTEKDCELKAIDITVSGDTMIISAGTKQKIKDFINNQKDIDPEFVEIVNKRFWDLLA